MNTQLSQKLALALDNIESKKDIELLVAATQQSIGVYKIGLEQFVRFGPPIIETVKTFNRRIFLDLKLHDIPNTVAKAVSSACDLGVDFLTIHTQGGSAMMKAAMQAKENHGGSRKPKIIGVTVLTSIDTPTLNHELNVSGDVSGQVRHLAALAVSAPIDGIVCSAADLPALEGTLPASFEVITPGIRPAGTDAHDQKRVATPTAAIARGATLLVLGRAVTAADDPSAAAKAILDEIADGMAPG